MKNTSKVTNNISFSLYSRYRSLSEAVGRYRHGNEKLTILEVGGKGSYLRYFLPNDKITLLDAQDSDEPDFVKGDGRNLPFNNKNFDLAVSTDVLEHIPQKDRSKFINEQIRVAKRGIVLAAPFFTPEVAQIEQQASELYKLNTGKEHIWLKEHLNFKLPKAKELELILAKNRFKFQKLYSQKLSLWSNLIKIELLVAANFTSKIEEFYKSFNHFYNQFVYQVDQDPPAYRTLYLIVFKGVKLKPALAKKQKSSEDILKKVLQFSTDILVAVEEHRQSIINQKDLHIKQQSQADRNLKKQFEQANQNLNKQIEKISRLSKKIRLDRQDFADKINQLTQSNYDLNARLSEYHSHITTIESSKIWRLFRITTKIIDTIIKPRVAAKNTLQLRGGLLHLIHQRLDYSKFTNNIPDINAQYLKWLEQNKLSPSDIKLCRKKAGNFKLQPLVSIITPLYKTRIQWLDELVKSVKNQIYTNWELCLVDDGTNSQKLTRYLKKIESDPKIKVKINTLNKGIVGASNEAIKMSRGSYILFLDHDDTISQDALFWVADAINKNLKIDLIYADEDKLDSQGKRCDPYFKPDWSKYHLLSQMYLPHLAVYRRFLGDKLGWMRKGYDGSQDYDLALRFTEQTKNIHHIPKILYHWRKVKGSTALSTDQKSYTSTVSMKALQSAVKRRGVEAKVELGLQPETFRVNFQIKDNPLVSIIIPTKDQARLLSKCIGSILRKSDYPNYEIIILDNNSSDPTTHEYFNIITKNKSVKVVKYNYPFNFAAINNFGASIAKGKYLLFLNNDIEAISRSWITAMLSLAAQKDIGAVGAKLLYPNKTIQHAGVVLGIGGVAGHSHKYIPDSFPGYFSLKDIVREYSAVTAGCLMIEKRKFNAVNGFDENYKVAFNDIDFCLRLRKKGWVNLYTPYAKLYHHESVSVGKLDKGERDITLLQKEAARMQSKWGKLLKNDPYYNANLSKKIENYGLNI